MNLDIIEENINQCQTVFKSLIVDTNYIRTDRFTISWQNYKSGINSDLYLKYFEKMIDGRQFSFLLKDNSIIQIFYKSNEDDIIKYKLAYYPTPLVKQLSSSDLESYFDESTNEMYLDYYYQLFNNYGSEFLYSNSNHIRFDYDFTVSTHFKNHIQFGGINDLRIPFKFLLVPFNFIDFLVRNIYPKQFAIIKEKPAYKHLRGRSSDYIEIERLTDYNSFFMHKG